MNSRGKKFFRPFTPPPVDDDPFNSPSDSQPQPVLGGFEFGSSKKPVSRLLWPTSKANPEVASWCARSDTGSTLSPFAITHTSRKAPKLAPLDRTLVSTPSDMDSTDDDLVQADSISVSDDADSNPSTDVSLESESTLATDAVEPVVDSPLPKDAESSTQASSKTSQPLIFHFLRAPPRTPRNRAHLAPCPETPNRTPAPSKLQFLPAPSPLFEPSQHRLHSPFQSWRRVKSPSKVAPAVSDKTPLKAAEPAVAAPRGTKRTADALGNARKRVRS